MNSTKWKLAEKIPKELVDQFVAGSEYSPIILQLLYNRDIIGNKRQATSDKIKIEKFLNPDYDRDLYDPFLMKDMKKAVVRIKKAICNKEKIAIFGDYDADGICATVLLKETLKFLDIDPDIYIPHRGEEGYGLNEKAIDELEKKKINLIITCDCGIRSIKEVGQAHKLKIDVIVTDHHIPMNREQVTSDKGQGIRNKEEVLPKAYAILNPKQNSCKYPFKELAGVGVAYKLAQALLKDQRSKIKNQKSKRCENQRFYKNQNFLKWLLDLVAIGTVADIVPLVSENRVLVKYGLIVLRKTKRKGLLNLIKKAEIQLENINNYTIGYIIAPRLNATGRLDHANKSYKLLVSESSKQAWKLASEIEDLNQQRKNLTEQIFQEAKKRLADMAYITQKNKIIILSDSSWDVGVVGIVAGKLVEEFSRPALVVKEGKVINKGSARSIPAFNITLALEKCSDLFEKVGGHRQAAGFSYKAENHKVIFNRLSKAASLKLSDNDIKKRINIDTEINPEDINWKLYENLEKFKPYGEGNSKPKFLIRDLEIADIQTVGNDGQHLKLALSITQNPSPNTQYPTIEAIGFNLTENNNHLRIGDKVDIVFNLICNLWNGNKRLQIKIVDIKNIIKK